MDYELIWWCVVGAIALIFLIAIMLTPNDSEIEITWGKRRDWERWEKQWK